MKKKTEAIKDEEVESTLKEPYHLLFKKQRIRFDFWVKKKIAMNIDTGENDLHKFNKKDMILLYNWLKIILKGEV